MPACGRNFRSAHHHRVNLGVFVKKTLIIIPLLAAGPLFSQDWEVGLFTGQQAYKTAVFVDSFGSLDTKVDSKSVAALRAGYSFKDLGPCRIQGTVAFQPSSSANATIVSTNGPIVRTITGDFKEQYWSLGGMANFKTLVAFGVGLEYRAEKLSTEDLSTTYGRAWFRANAGYEIPTPRAKIFIGLEGAVPLSSQNPDASAEDNDNLKAVAPKGQIGVYAAVRF
jgi:hypothetical protein